MTFEQTEMCLSLTTKWIHVFIHLYTTRLEWRYHSETASGALYNIRKT